MQTATKNQSFDLTTFAAKPDTESRLLKRGLDLIADRPNANILDLGCGVGAVAIGAAIERQDVHVTALDISASNIAALKDAARNAGVIDRMTAVCGDYVTEQPKKYDLIVSDSVLNLLPCSDEVLASRLAGDLTPNGVLVVAMPVSVFSNSLRVALRKCWRLMPAVADRLVLALAKRVYPHLPTAVLADRIPYLRILPVRLFGPSMQAAFARHGLEVVENTLFPSESIAKLTHHLIVWRRQPY